MKNNYSLLFLLLMTQKVCWANGDCLYNTLLRQCSCSLVDLTNIMSIVSCIQASSFEFQGGSLIDVNDYALHNIEMEQVLAMIPLPLAKISFINVVLSEEFLATFIRWVYRIPINVLAFENAKFVGNPNWQFISETTPQISSLQFINVSSYPLFDRASNFTSLGRWIFKLEQLTLKNSNLKNIPCDTSQRFKDLSSLDLSENFFQDQDISTSFCHGSFPKLKTLILQHNNLINYETVCQALNKYPQLEHLDMSQNDFSNTSSFLCPWQPSLLLLNMSDTCLEELNNDLTLSCEVLDLSNNRLYSLNISLPKLKELYLSNNKFVTIPNTANLPSLEILAIDGNPIKTLQLGQLQHYKRLHSIRADNMTYECSCSLFNEIKEIKKSGLTLQRWPDGYSCDSPSLFRGKLVSEVSLSFFECHKPLLIVVICIVILLVSIATFICWLKIHQRKKTRSEHLQAGNQSSVQFQS
ncbi:toll-like receptor 2 [Spea bombifrons]|uniref:toll-like receptor 2 n=1 Tax=Spea bombifrons TaxID=233779 RepID=UPI0023492B32|nr:toll-like receptor 2 [Spea bombifrons]